jgi:hypothetical protein
VGRPGLKTWKAPKLVPGEIIDIPQLRALYTVKPDRPFVPRIVVPNGTILRSELSLLASLISSSKEVTILVPSSASPPSSVRPAVGRERAEEGMLISIMKKNISVVFVAGLVSV